MLNARFELVFLALGPLAAEGCTEPRHVTANVVVTATDDATLVESELTDRATAEAIDPEPGDQLVMSIDGGDPEVLELPGSMELEPLADATFAFVFSDSNQEVTAEIDLPAEFDITAPTVETDVSRAGDLYVEWTAGGADTHMLWGLSSPCLPADLTFGPFAPIEDNGATVFPLEDVDWELNGDECAATFALRRSPGSPESADAAVDDALGEAVLGAVGEDEPGLALSVDAGQNRSVDFTTVP